MAFSHPRMKSYNLHRLHCSERSLTLRSTDRRTSGHGNSKKIGRYSDSKRKISEKKENETSKATNVLVSGWLICRPSLGNTAIYQLIFSPNSPFFPQILIIFLLYTIAQSVAIMTIWNAKYFHGNTLSPETTRTIPSDTWKKNFQKPSLMTLIDPFLRIVNEEER